VRWTHEWTNGYNIIYYILYIYIYIYMLWWYILSVSRKRHHRIFIIKHRDFDDDRLVVDYKWYRLEGNRKTERKKTEKSKQTMAPIIYTYTYCYYYYLRRRECARHILDDGGPPPQRCNELEQQCWCRIIAIVCSRLSDRGNPVAPDASRD
jgi:hypothetical protein